MNTAVHYSTTHSVMPSENTLIWAIVGSMLLHVFLVFIVPNFTFDTVKKPDVLEIQLVNKPEPPPPPPPPEPIKPTPEPVKPVKPKIEPKPIIKPLPIPVPTVVKADVPPPPPPEVIAVAPKAEAPPSPVPPAPIVTPIPPPPPPIPNQADIDDALASYGNALWGEISKHKQYPKIAQMRGWQGEAIVELQLDGQGKLKSKKIIQSSGYEVLDKQALSMAEKATPFPLPPMTLRNSSFTIKVPVPFKLE